MNIELKPIAESKVRQLGGDVCGGVLVRKDQKLAAVDEHGRFTWLSDDVPGGPVELSGAEIESIKQRADAWLGLVELLNDLTPPEWRQRPGTGRESAFAAIRGLAQAASAQGGQSAEAVAWASPPLPDGTEQVTKELPERIYGVVPKDYQWYVRPLVYADTQPAGPEDEYEHLHRTIELLAKKLIKAESAVPEVPTEQMLEEGVTALTRGLKTFGGNYTQIVNNIWEDMAAALLSTPPTTPPQADGCEWHTDGNGCWMGACGKEFWFEDGGPSDNGMKYCLSCGKPCVEVGDPDEQSGGQDNAL